MESSKSDVYSSFERAYFVVVNGPPQSGKDTFGRFLCDQLNAFLVNGYAVEEKFAKPLKAALGAMFGLSDAKALRLFENDAYKSHDRYVFMGKTPRAALISLSEEWAKPFFGPDIYGELLVRRAALEMRRQIKPWPCVFVITDCGFQAEVDRLMQYASMANTWVVRLERPGCGFTGDSRNWITPADMSQLVKVQNSGGLLALEEAAVSLADQIIAVIEPPETPQAA